MVLSLRDVTAGYDGIAVVHGVDLEVRAGEVVALLGANGAGKTTTLLTVSGLLARMGGAIEVLGRPAPARRRPSVAAVWKRARAGSPTCPRTVGCSSTSRPARTCAWAVPGDIRRRGDVVPEEQLLEWFPALGQVHGPQGGTALGRRAADAGHRAGRA